MLLQFLFVVAFVTPQMASRDADIASALADLNKGRVLESIQQFKQIIRSDPSNGRAYFYLSTLYTQMNEFEVAERYVRRAMELNPQQSAYYLQLGLIRYRQKQWRAALDFLKEALKFGPGSNEATLWRNIGDVQVELFDRDAALQAYETSLRLQPRDAATRLALGRFYLDRSEPELAIKQLRAALEIEPSLQTPYPILGLAYRRLGNLTEAITVLRKALDVDPADQDSRYALGQVLLAAGRDDEGRKELDAYESVRQQVSTANAKYEAAQARLDAGRPGEAEQLLREAVQLAPKYGPALQSLGALLLDRGSARDASEMLQRAVQANPLRAANWFSLGKAYSKTGKLADALEAAKRALVLDDENKEYQRLVVELESRTRK
jgi:tetratricopeptide (TPR) repeat protein